MENNYRAVLEGLNSEQARAVECIEGPVLIIAGAGSGKTRVLTHRIAYILAGGGDPSRILALTFTRKAAGEMKERIAELVGGTRARRLCMGTFHSVFIRFLRDYAESIGYPPSFTVYDRGDSEAAIRACIRELNLDTQVYKYKEIMSRISMAKNSLVTADYYAANPQYMAEDTATKRQKLHEIFSLYEKRCREAGVMDFDDILVNMNILLRDNKEALEELSGRFDHIMVDEYQDTNYSQYLIIRKLSQRTRNICVVGDDSQSIYAFRGARIENILSFRKDYPDCKTFRLEQNYRSTQTIVEAANSLIAHNEGRIPKECFSKAEKGAKIRLVKSYSESDEAASIVGLIVSKLMEEHAEYQDFAVLYRTNNQSRSIEDALRRRNIPYMVYSGNAFYDRAEVKDMLAYFKLAVNPNDNESFKRIVNKPARAIGEVTVAALSVSAASMGCSLMQAALEADLEPFGLKRGARERLRAFAEMMAGFHARSAEEDAYSLATAIAEGSGLYAHYKSEGDVEAESRAANVAEVLNGVNEFVKERNESDYEDGLVEGTISADDAPEEVVLPKVLLADFLENVSLLSAVDVDESPDASNRVALMTAHSAKGLEFPYVVIAGMEENLFPSGSMFSSPAQIEEERRLFYVALTRAEKMVWLSYATERFRNGKHESNPPSRFLREIDSKYLENAGVLDDEVSLSSARGGVLWELKHNGGIGFGGSSGRNSVSVNSRQTVKSGVPVYQTNRGNQPSNHIVNRSPQPSNINKVSQPSVINRNSPPSDFVPDPISKLKVGQRVEHNKFGFGKILNITDGVRATVEFDNFGTKTLILGYAKFRVVE
ncbi:MAG: UvrD-helicase domain-containing protein [Bacteroidales bacterium]|nr:UvrD-helicase domain-containing protein [Bacteroidales bacterium]